jgi:hypothetical protein
VSSMAVSGLVKSLVSVMITLNPAVARGPGSDTIRPGGTVPQIAALTDVLVRMTTRYHLRLWSRCQAAPHTTGPPATAERRSGRSGRRSNAGQATLMPICE